MPYMMRGRNEAAVNVKNDVKLWRTDGFIRAFNESHPETPIDPFHIAIYAMRQTLAKYPEMNRFVAGGRIYQRRGIWFSYAVKTRLRDGAPVVVVKREHPPEESFEVMVAGMHAQVHEDRFGGEKYVDKELRLLFFFPGFVRRFIMWCIRLADRFGMLPRSVIEKDPMFTSTFFANLASIGMDACYHHLYEYGTCGFFAAIGRAVTEPGSPTSGPERRRTMNIRWTFDDRTGDGMVGAYGLRYFKQVMEDPAAYVDAS